MYLRSRALRAFAHIHPIPLVFLARVEAGFSNTRLVIPRMECVPGEVVADLAQSQTPRAKTNLEQLVEHPPWKAQARQHRE